MKRNPTNTIGIAVIGCGGRQRTLLKTLLADSPQLKVVGFLDPSEAAIAEAQAVCGGNVPVCESFDALLADDAVDWVMIGTPNFLHCEQSVAAMRAGKHVFCEKPLATTIDDCLLIDRVRTETGARFVMGFNMRYSPHYRKLHEIIRNGDIGDVINFEMNETLSFNHGSHTSQGWRGQRATSGSMLLEKCCHDIDIANWLADSLPARVASFGGRNFFRPEYAGQIERIGPDPATGTPAFHRHNRRKLHSPFNNDHDVFDNQVVIIEYTNGMRMSFFLNCMAAHQQRRSFICGSEGSIVADALRGEVRVRPLGWNQPEIHYDTHGKGGHGGADPILTDQLARCMLDGEEPKVSLREGLISAVTCLAIDQAAETHQVVELEPLWAKLG